MSTKTPAPNASQSSKRAIKEKENEFFLGGMRNPDLTVAKMHLVRSVGADISRAWNHFLEEHPRAVDIAEKYGGANCEPPDPYLGYAWMKVLENILKAKDFKDVVVKEEFEFNSPLNTKLWEAWIKATGDPECHVVEWARKGVPLGMNVEIPTCGIFPAMPEEDWAQEDGQPHGSDTESQRRRPRQEQGHRRHVAKRRQQQSPGTREVSTTTGG